MKLTLAIATLAFPCICSAGYLHTVAFDSPTRDARADYRADSREHSDRSIAALSRLDFTTDWLSAPRNMFGGGDSLSYNWISRDRDDDFVGFRGFESYQSHPFERFGSGRFWQLDDPHLQFGNHGNWQLPGIPEGTVGHSVPEPGTIALLGAGLFGLALIARRKRLEG